MAAKGKKTGVGSGNGNDGRWLTGFLADEDRFDRRAFWRLGAWGFAAVAAVALAVTANRFQPLQRRDQIAADLAAQSRQWQRVAQSAEAEARRLSLAVDTLNSDRDRLYARVATLEQNLDSVTGSIARQAPASAALAVKPAPPPASETAPPAAQAVETEPALTPPSPPLLPKLAILTPPDTSTAKPLEPPASISTAAEKTTQDSAPEVAVQRTAFGVDLGGATTLSGLRTLWRRVAKANKELEALRPVVAIQEHQGGGRLHLRLLAGPLDDAAEAAKICASLASRQQPCETSVFDGQRLALDVPSPAPRAVPRHRAAPRPAHAEPPKPVHPPIVQPAR